jgi:hypothetical protein
MENKFLRDFVRQQNQIIESGIVEKARKKHKSKHGTADGKAPFGEDDLSAKLAKLCQKKQSRKFLLEYYRERVAQLCAEDAW